MKLSTGILEKWGFHLKAQLNTNMWGREVDTHVTWHIFCINWSKTKQGNGYAVSVILLPFSIIIGYTWR